MRAKARGTDIMRANRDVKTCAVRVCRAVFVLAALAPIAPACATPSEPPAQTGEACPQAGTARAAVANIDERLEITLKDWANLATRGAGAAAPDARCPDFDATARQFHADPDPCAGFPLRTAKHR